MKTDKEKYSINWDTKEQWYILTFVADGYSCAAWILEQTKEAFEAGILPNGFFPYGTTDKEYDNELNGEVFRDSITGDFISKNGFYIGTYE